MPPRLGAVHTPTPIIYELLQAQSVGCVCVYVCCSLGLLLVSLCCTLAVSTSPDVVHSCSGYLTRGIHTSTFVPTCAFAGVLDLTWVGLPP